MGRFNTTVQTDQQTKVIEANLKLSSSGTAVAARAEKVQIVSGSCAGASSSQFHNFLQSRKRETERWNKIEQSAKDEEEKREFAERVERNKLEAEERTKKNAAKRNKKKEKKRAKKREKDNITSDNNDLDNNKDNDDSDNDNNDNNDDDNNANKKQRICEES